MSNFKHEVEQLRANYSGGQGIEISLEALQVLEAELARREPQDGGADKRTIHCGGVRAEDLALPKNLTLDLGDGRYLVLERWSFMVGVDGAVMLESRAFVLRRSEDLDDRTEEVDE